MKKKLILRGLLGVPLGIAIGQIITVIVSLCIGDGLFYPVRPELVGAMRGELNAVLLKRRSAGSWARALRWLLLSGRSIHGALQSKAGSILQSPAR